MDDKEFKAYVELLASMSTDFLTGGITRGTFEDNFKIVSGKIITQKVNAELEQLEQQG